MTQPIHQALLSSVSDDCQGPGASSCQKAGTSVPSRINSTVHSPVGSIGPCHRTDMPLGHA
jgi:hypothetical protein